MLQAALGLAAKGYHVFPVRRGSKAPPRFKDWPTRASIDPTKIRKWWGGGGADDNIAIACGASGILVVDVDVKRAVDGFAALAELEAACGPLPCTCCVRTPSGGLHIYLRNPAGIGNLKLAPGVETRGVGGYVLAPPSRLDGVGAYRRERPGPPYRRPGANGVAP